MRNLHETAVEQGLRDRIVLIAGGPQVTDEVAFRMQKNTGWCLEATV